MGSKVYVGGLPFSATDSQLNDLFAPHGTVASAQVIQLRVGRRKRQASLRPVTPHAILCNTPCLLIC